MSENSVVSDDGRMNRNFQNPPLIKYSNHLPIKNCNHPLIRICCASLWLLAITGFTGCGKTIQHQATEQLLVSDAVDRAVASIDFSPLKGASVYFDDRYLHNIKGIGFVNSAYITSAIRQQIVTSGCLLAERVDQAEIIVEARVGALGTDEFELTYGMPATNLLSTATALVPTAPPIPTIPEISFAKKHNEFGSAKIGVFAYEKETRAVVWQSGVKQGNSKARESWVLGAGPFQSGTIYEGPQLAGNKIITPFYTDKNTREAREFVKTNHYYKTKTFESELLAKKREEQSPSPDEVNLVGHEKDGEKPAAKEAKTKDAKSEKTESGKPGKIQLKKTAPLKKK